LANRCNYSFTHHWANVCRLLTNGAEANRILEALRSGIFEEVFSRKEQTLLRYAHKLTVAPGDVSKTDVAECQAAGADDGEILEVNQVCAYFNYSNRLLNGLGVPLGDDVVGYYNEE
jgi:uncharacterized peroxidase-related enzyme